MEVLDATAALILLPPNLLVNEKPICLRDKLIGAASEFYNDMIYYSHINATIVPADGMGRCNYAPQGAQCSGIVGLLHSATANISLLPILLDFDPRLDVPIELNFPVFQQKQVFLSPPISNVTMTGLHILNTAQNFNKQLLLIYVSLYVCFVFLINWSSVSARRSRFRLLWPDVFGLLINVPSCKTFRSCRRRLTFLMAVILTFFYYQLYLCSTHTELVLRQPEQYLETLAEVASADHTVILLKGLTVDHAFEKSDDPNVVNINERADKLAANGSQVIGVIAEKLMNNKTVAFMESRYLAYVTQGIVCLLSDHEPKAKLQLSPPFGHTSPSSVVSKSADVRLKKRFRSAMSRMMQSGHFAVLMADIKTRSLSNFNDGMLGKGIFTCMRVMNEKEVEEPEEPIIVFRAFRMILRLPATSYIAAAGVLLIERFWKWSLRKRKQSMQVVQS